MEILEVPKTLEQLEAEKAIIELKGVFKEGSLTLAPVKDPRRPGFYLGVDKLSEDQKKTKEYYVEPDKLTIKIKEGTTFDLSQEYLIGLKICLTISNLWNHKKWFHFPL